MQVLPYYFVGVALLALGFAGFLSMRIFKEDEGTDKMKEIANELGIKFDVKSK